MSKSLPPRRSARATKGKVPARFLADVMENQPKGDEILQNGAARNDEVHPGNMGVNKNQVPLENTSLKFENMGLSKVSTRQNEQSVKSSSIITNSSSIKRRQLEIELERERRLAEIERRLIEKETELKRAELKSSHSNSRPRSYVPEEIQSVSSKTSYVQDWVNNLKESQQEENYIENGAETLNINKFLARQSFSKELPIFSGEPGEWMNFINQFNETNKICGYSDSENIIRLQKCLKGKARESVNALLSFTQDVPKIIKTLELRYGRPEIIVQDLIEAVQKIPCIKEDKLEYMLDFSNKINNLAVTVKSLKCQEYLSNPQLLNDVVKKMNSNLKLEWGKKIIELKRQDKPITISEFSLWLEETSEAVMYVVDKDVDHDKRKRYVCSTSVHSEKPNEKPIHKCKFCKKDGHKVDKCHEFNKLEVDKRWDWVRENRVCFTCLGSSHQARFCRSKNKCKINHCTFKHHPSLHKDIQSITEEETTCQLNNLEINHEILLRIAPVELTGPNGSFNTYALFDEASTITMIDSSVADEIGATGPTENLKIRWTNSMTCEEQYSKKVSLKIRGKQEQETYTLNNVRTVGDLSLPVQSINMNNFNKKWVHLRQIQIPSLIDAKPKILIGQDNIDLIIAREVHEGGKNAPILSKSKLGWVVHGNIKKSHLGRIDEFSCFVNHQNCDLNELVRNSFEIDSLGVKLHETHKDSADIRAYEILERTTRRVSMNRWETGLLWKWDDFNLPKNKFTASTRLKYIEKKMDKDELFAGEYAKKISDYLEKGYARKLSTDDLNKKNDKIWYLPHFAVSNKNKPGKIRFVFDAAARINGISLNDVLLKGPDLLNSLLGVIFKFRQKNIAFTGDIMDMFHQVQIRPEDRSVQRFLWRGRERYGEPDEYEMVSMIFGAVSSPATAQYVMRMNAIEFKDTFPGAVRAINEQHYVDDYLDSVDFVEEAKKRISEVIEVHRRGGFVIRNWSCNSKEVLRSIPEKLRSDNTKDMDLDKESLLPVERVLGLVWNPNDDNFVFSMKRSDDELQSLSEKGITKRGVLKIVMTIFDPFGFLSNFTIKARILLQDIWRSKIDWDDEIDKDLLKKWRSWLKELKDLNKLKIPRCYVHDIFKAEDIQLHVFCDSSAQAYSAVAYFRIKMKESTVVSLVMAKSRVTPLKPMSIPRLELQAAVLGSRLAITIKDNHSIKISSTHFWTDSRNVISWIKTDASNFKPFVAHRVVEITDSSDAKFWKWLPTKENVADEATRDCNSVDWKDRSRWLNGPQFLRAEMDNWPHFEAIVTDTSEMKKKFVGAAIKVSIDLRQSLPDLRKFSSWLRLIRATAWIIRFKEKIMKKTQKSTELTPEEIEIAEKLWLKCVQSEDFEEEVYCLQNGQAIEPSSRLHKLSPILDPDGIIRLRSRLIYSNDLGEDTKYPIILDPKNHFTKLLIYQYHLKARHNGQAYVVNELRQRYWILNVRSAVRSSWFNCQWCKNKRAKTEAPEMSPLPSCRLTSFVRPFTITGMDYFGPMFVTIGRRKEKRYGVLFTCMSTRAVHLKVAHSLSTDSTIMAIRRLAGRRGFPKKIFSDNGTNLKGAEKELKKALQELDQNRITSNLTTNNIEWHFISPLAPHMGGSWERLVRSVKTSLSVILKEKAPKEEVLHTLLIEAENIVNSRPLVHVSLDKSDEEALTPNHFLLGSSSSAQLPGKFDEGDLISRKQWRISQLLADHFWRRWIREYLPVLTKRTKWFLPSKREIKVGDVVIVVDGDYYRNSWPKGIVTAVHPGSDGHVRVVDIKTAVGEYRRPVTKLCILDVRKPQE